MRYVGEYGLIRKGADLPEILTHIPMAMQGPCVCTQGLREDVCVSVIDLYPTICDMLNTPLPLGVQGKSLLPILRKEAYPTHEFDTAYMESGFSGLYWTEEDDLALAAEGASDEGMKRFDCLNTWTQCGQVRAVRKGDWKLQCDMMCRTYLYNLAEDPFEGHNLADDPAFAAQRGEMLLELAAAMMKADDPLPFPHHRYRTKLHPRNYWLDEEYRSGDVGVRDLPPMGNH